MWGDDRVETGGTWGGSGSERILLRQNKGDRSVLNTPQGGQQRRDYLQGGSGWGFLKGEDKEAWRPMESYPFLVTMSGCKQPIGQ